MPLCVGVCLNACSFVEGKWPLSVSQPVCVWVCARMCVAVCAGCERSHVFFNELQGASASAYTARNSTIESGSENLTNKLVKIE